MWNGKNVTLYSTHLYAHALIHARTHTHTRAHTHTQTHTREHTHTHTHKREYNRANAESYLHTGHVTDISGMHFFLEENTFC